MECGAKAARVALPQTATVLIEGISIQTCTGRTPRRDCHSARPVACRAAVPPLSQPAARAPAQSIGVADEAPPRNGVCTESSKEIRKRPLVER